MARDCGTCRVGSRASGVLISRFNNRGVRILESVSLKVFREQVSRDVEIIYDRGSQPLVREGGTRTEESGDDSDVI